MDRASILGDAIEYLKELLQKINDLHNELESTPSTSSLPPSSTATTPTSFHPLTPTLPTLPSRVKEELCPSSLPSPNSQPARVSYYLLNQFLTLILCACFCGCFHGFLVLCNRIISPLYMLNVELEFVVPFYRICFFLSLYIELTLVCSCKFPILHIYPSNYVKLHKYT